MRAFNSFLALLNASTVVVAALENLHEKATKYTKRASVSPAFTRDAQKKAPTSLFLTDKTKKFAVNSNAIPEVDFDLGESYAGLLPISANKNDDNQLWFWFFPSQNTEAKNEIAIWLNGGPGCSSLDGLLQANGPFLWQSGTYQPIQNPYSWTNLTNMIWIDQPVGTGFSRGSINVTSEIDVANQFMGFWKNFVDTFSIKGYKIYIIGESYAGLYVPYIASGMLDKKDRNYFDVKGIQINDPVINNYDVLLQTSVVPALQYYQNIINLNESYLQSLSDRADKCGYTDFFNEYSNQFPPGGRFPAAPDSGIPGCDLYDDIQTAAEYVNPCFNIYHLTDYCPYLWNQLEFPSLAGGPHDYFNRSDVQAQLHVQPTNFYVCNYTSNMFPDGDLSLPSALGPLPSVIERTNNVIIGHGLLDFLLFANASLITIQNMTWNGKQGFQSPPSKTQNFFVPYHQSLGAIQEEDGYAFPNQPPVYDTAGAGFQGTTHTERGLTFVTVALAGHGIPQYTPGAAYRQFEFLLGRILSLEQTGDYTTQTGNFTGTAAPLE